MKDVNIVVVNYKMKDEIDQCLTSLFLDLKYSNLDVNVVVVDNASDDGIEDFLKNKFPPVNCIILSENKGFGFAQNTGIKSVEAKYYFILNPDTVFPANKHCIQALYNFMEANQKIGMVGPKLIYPDGSLQYSCWRLPPFLQPFYQRTKLGQTASGKKKVAYHHMRDFDHNKTQAVDWLMGSACLVSRQAIEKVGLMDEKLFLYFSDVDWARRFWENGYKVVYYPESVMYHHLHRNSKGRLGILDAFFKRESRWHIADAIRYFKKWGISTPPSRT